ncbi:MAG TPA: alpha/beta fold hydrolase, partial [Sedimentibacter sp.]|nr:alpha/beta fold hydrolase [Sedimentibacter sp.]
LMQKIAERGYTCVLMKMPFNLAVFDIDAADRAFKEIAEVDFWYVGGHSLGGAMSSEFAQKNPEKIKGIILLGAYTSGDLSNTDLKLLSIYGSEDKILNLEALEESKTKEPKDSRLQIIKGGNHAYFGNYKEQKGDGIAYITNDEQQNMTADMIAEFFEASNE